jgi:hypothetical protein
VQIRPERLNTAIAGLFAIGSACFVIGSVPAFVTAVGGYADSITYAIGAVFFTTASALQLLQVQSPGMLDVDVEEQHRPTPLRWWGPRLTDRGWWAAATQFPGTLCFNVSTIAALAHNATVAQQQRYVWRPDAFGSTLFLISSVLAVLALGRFWSWLPGSAPWRIAWINLLGSVLFGLSALAGYILPSGDVVSVRISVAATLLGAVCFAIGALLLLPAWRAAVHAVPPHPSTSPPPPDRPVNERGRP